ncbi:sigma-70 family RNA polymerase sigma factor [Euhalothece natronophila Z-M001]|uniref:Sigma-70 family RNA polymerase sigma factor n=1 Tax=Euhalothece natronophila Z-M001 TaxID=522448 RepID=A0A5B8NNH1_9CHRO|nr:sigma-70 family RNA polymerase sigma factor [Euhalothece natronophila]QDZ40476.1 sigma-70 family RNA polymerase sigma factor [Euhalothece natronophila Z-M001]
MLTEANPSEIELVKRCQKGDQESFRLLYRRYQRRVRSTLYQLCGDSILDDLVQEVFFRAWKGLPTLRKPKTFSTWLYRICWNVASDQRRAFAQLREQHQTLSQKQSNPDHPELNQMHYQDLVDRGLKTLSLEQRAVIVLHDLEDIPQKEVAQILNIPLGTVKSRLFHGRKVLREFLKEQGVVL